MSNDTYKALIDAMVAERSRELGDANKNKAFENIANNLILERFDLSVDEIDAGVTDGSGDGQIDSMYVIVNGTILTEEEPEEIPEKGPLEIDIQIIQSKNCDSFEENPLKIIRNTVSDLLNLGAGYDNYLDRYNEALQDKFALARKALLASAGREAKIRVKVSYATKGRTDSIHPSVSSTADALKADLSRLAATPDVDVEFFGAEKLINISRQPKTRKRDLEVQQHLSSDSGDSFACLVTIDSLVRFLGDEKGDLVRSLFDANVRDFLGKTEVNDAIRTTLESTSDEDFWWLNNGITIVASAIDQKGKKLALTEPLLVNGLQTSSVVFSFMKDQAVSTEFREKKGKQIILTKIIVPPNEKIRDDIIKATNSQTHIPKPYLRGMDIVHRNIEDHLKGAGLFYERRKNQYKNLGKSRSTIVTLAEMAQALMAAFLFRSSDARGRPNSLLKSDDDYKSLFSADYPLDSFKNVILAKHEIIRILAETCPEGGAGFRNDVVYHVLAYVSAVDFHNLKHAAQGWKDKTCSKTELEAAVTAVVALFREGGATDRVAKSPAFQGTVINAAKSLRSPSAT
ncbi:AIPR family protein [Methylocystis echinoides]|uniref:Abortive phage infection protein C-terminal domain-containing protein n=1 Tax=Methylocystis echinoides TaxID=29468 RepID=A0A9W6LSL7_9HYPH|nr:AIPR family protein [Methylocystis echinoides]GLI93713.1 hypothetical protein LMG27198_27050 [Methylocystis echinoides]